MVRRDYSALPAAEDESKRCSWLSFYILELLHVGNYVVEGPLARPLCVFSCDSAQERLTDDMNKWAHPSRPIWAELPWCITCHAANNQK